VGEEKRTLHGVRKALEAEGVPSPSGNDRWSTWVIRRFVLNDVYRPHAFEEIAALVTPEVAAGLDPKRRYGVWWFNRERWTTSQTFDVSTGGRVYRRIVRVVSKPKDEWVAVPVPDSGLPQGMVDAARETVLKNRPTASGEDRFWELSGGILRCRECGRRMRTCTTRKRSGKRYFYYACAKRREEGDTCPNRRSPRADVLESAVWRAVSKLLEDSEAVRQGFEARIRLECGGAPGGDPGATERALLERIVESDRERSAYQEMAAKGLMTFDELGARLREVEESRAVILRELREVGSRREGVESLEGDRDALLGSYAASDLEALKRLGPEERKRVYRMLRLEALLGADGVLSVEGVAWAAPLGVIK
jgi:site-specific DNA recombinase